MTTLAWMVLLIHFLWIVFLVPAFPLWLYLNRRKLRIVHAGGLGAMLVMQVARIACPLTVLEQYLIQRAKADFSYGESWLIYYLHHMVYVDVSLLHITILTVCFLILVILSFWFRPLKSPPR